MKLSLISIERDMIRLEADGPITTADFKSDGKHLFEQLLGQNWTKNVVVLDFEKVSSIDSSAIGWLIATTKEIGAGGGKLVLHSVQPQVKQILALVRVDRALTIVKDEAAARAAIAEGAAK